MAHEKSCILDSSHPTPRHLFDVNQWGIRQCQSCGMIMTGSVSSEAEYGHDDYYTMRFNKSDDIYSEWAFRWRWILKEIHKHKNPGTLLDLGAGNGLFVKIASEECGWRSRGLVLTDTEAAFARRALDVELETLPLSEIGETFDVLTSFNVLEHVVDPVALIGEMRGALVSGGLVAISTPNPGCIQARRKGLQKWGMISPPHHVNIFTRRSLELALRKSEFRILSYNTISTYIGGARGLEAYGVPARKMAFEVLRQTFLGADHFIIAQAQ